LRARIITSFTDEQAPLMRAIRSLQFVAGFVALLAARVAVGIAIGSALGSLI
jgi:hypothetical protein